MDLRNSFSEYTEQEFVEFIRDIFKEDSAETDERLDVLLDHFKDIVEHPQGTDLIYYAPSVAESTPEAITKRIKEWRAANGKSGFKIL
ncbi:MAG TPA: bacteriocin immunity protein [Pseudomonas sp.]|uniref:bacteriocin immunity protein n=1 Tax=Pseudomonas sp. TaxID=306 RepID=UPI000ED7577B|nr:bacteriocin immunity protein [Pseudomonas sp.]HCN66294.1 bacteriocin immunity protein [Pseudomonas sp.]